MLSEVLSLFDEKLFLHFIHFRSLQEAEEHLSATLQKLNQRCAS